MGHQKLRTFVNLVSEQTEHDTDFCKIYWTMKFIHVLFKKEHVHKNVLFAVYCELVESIDPTFFENEAGNAITDNDVHYWKFQNDFVNLDDMQFQ